MGFYLNKILFKFYSSVLLKHWSLYLHKQQLKMLGRVSSVVLRRCYSGGASGNITYLPANSAQNLLPFNPYQNKWGLLTKIGIFAGSGFALPFVVMVFTNWKKNGFTDGR